MSAPLVSVVIPAYNSEQFIAGALRSVLAQTFTDFEVIVVNDGSKDQTEERARAVSDRVRVISQKNAGAGAARNTGIREALGSWIAFLDSDDEWRPDHLDLLLRQAKAQPEAHLVYGSKTTIGEDGIPVRHADVPRFPTGWIFGDLVDDCIISTSTILVRTDTLRALGGFDERREFQVSQDWDLYLRLAAKHPVTATRDTNVTYRRRAASLSHQVAPTQMGIFAALATAERLVSAGAVAPENRPETIDLRARRSRAYHEAVVQLFTVGEYQDARRTGLEALRSGSRSVAIASRALLSCLPGPVIDRVRGWARLPSRYLAARREAH